VRFAGRILLVILFFAIWRWTIAQQQACLPQGIRKPGRLKQVSQAQPYYQQGK
jgi:hypothetical protein